VIENRLKQADHTSAHDLEESSSATNGWPGLAAALTVVSSK
jgi:hypothetical protein